MASPPPLIGEFTRETYASLQAVDTHLAYIFAETPKECAQLATSLEAVAQKHQSALRFVTVNAQVFGGYANRLSLPAGQWPAFAIQDPRSKKSYPYDAGAAMTAELIGEFVQDFIDGRIAATIQSEAVPAHQEGAVQTVVGLNYDEVVLDDSKDVLLEFYAPWCGPCRALAPRLEQLASLYIEQGKGNQVTIAKVDFTKNNVPGEITAFPTIMLYRARNKEDPVTYSGSLGLKNLIEFIQVHGTHGVSVIGNEGLEALRKA